MSSNIINQLPKKSVAPSEKFEKSSGNLNDIEVTMAMISRKDLNDKKYNQNTNKYTFQGKSARSNHWFDLDHEWLGENLVHVKWSSIFKTL